MRNSPRVLSGLWLAACVAVVLSPLASAGQEPALTIGLQRGEMTLALEGDVAFHSTANRIVDASVVAVPASNGVAVVWTEMLPDGGTYHFYAVSLDGESFSRAFPTTNQVQLRFTHFDPAQDSEPAVPQLLQADASNRIYIVQFAAQALEAFQNELASAGATIHAFLPEQAVMAEMSADAAAHVAQFPFVRWVGPVHPAYKLDEKILDAIDADAGDTTLYDFSVLVFGRGMDQQQPIVDYIMATGGSVMNTAPDGVRMTVTVTLPQVIEIARMNQVHFIDPWGPGETDMDIVREIGGANYVEAQTGYSGQGVRGEIFDTGVYPNHPEWAGQVPLTHGATNLDTHGNACYGINFATGVNPQARGLCPSREQGIFCYYSHSSQFGGPATRLALNTEATDPNGPFWSIFQTSSVGSPRTRQYTSISAETDDYLFLVDYLSCQSMSNAGLTPDVRPQAWAKNIVGVGGIEHGDTLTRTDDYSAGSTGPAADNRIKPELAHFYGDVFTTYSSSGYGQFGGTSCATPCTAGHFALLQQMWHEGVFEDFGGGPSVFADRPWTTTAKALLINTAYRYDWNSGGSNSNMWRDRQGWGMANLKNVYDNRENMVIINETDLLTPLGMNEYIVNVPENTPEFAATLVYRDPKGNPANQTQHRVNDLTLKVIDPDDVVYWGNNGLRDDNWSTPGGSPNTKDTVENVFVENPKQGTWTVQIHGDEIVQDSHVETPAMDADYGLVIRGVMPCSPAGMIMLDADAYSCAASATIQVIDCDLNADPNVVETVNVTIKSDSEPAGEVVLLTETGVGTAAFQGAIDLSDTNAAGVLLVAHGDLVTAIYIDADNGQGGYNIEVTVEADVDCVAPQISNVDVLLGDVYATVTFDADEPVLATVYYGTSCGVLDKQASSVEFSTSPEVLLENLTPSTRYYFAVEAQDSVENTTYDDNGGQCYGFRTVAGPGPVYFFDMSTNPGWSTEGQWAYGQPTGQGGGYGNPDPTSGHTGANVYGYNLNGDYANNMPEYDLTTGALDCTDVSGTKLRFWRWLGVERSQYDHAYVRISTDGNNWSQVWHNPDEETADGAWTFIEYDIAQWADGEPEIYIRWTIGVTDGGWTYCGWNIDDVVIWGLVPEYVLGDLNCDGLVDFGDINPFVLALTDPAGYAAAFPDCDIMSGDINEDGLVDFADINPFVRLLTQP